MNYLNIEYEEKIYYKKEEWFYVNIFNISA